MTDDLYQQIILEEYRHPQHSGHLAQPTASVNLENASCGDKLTVEIQLNAAGQVVDLAWSGQGCAISQASASLVSDFVLSQKLTLSQAASLTEAEVLPLLGLTKIVSGRQKCLAMITSAFRKLNQEAKTS